METVWLRLPVLLLLQLVSSSPTSTFLQGRVNVPQSMYGEGYYVVGTFRGSQNFGQVTKCDRTYSYCRVVSRMVLKARGISDVFLAHYDEHNKPQWAIRAGSDGEDKGRALAVDAADGNLVIFGYFSGIARFGHLTIKSTRPRLDCARCCAGFVAKYLKDGRALWVRELGQPTHKGPQDAQTKSSVDYWDARAVEFMQANPEPQCNLDPEPLQFCWWLDSKDVLNPQCVMDDHLLAYQTF